LPQNIKRQGIAAAPRSYARVIARKTDQRQALPQTINVRALLQNDQTPGHAANDQNARHCRKTIERQALPQRLKRQGHCQTIKRQWVIRKTTKRQGTAATPFKRQYCCRTNKTSGIRKRSNAGGHTPQTINARAIPQTDQTPG
jgi:hypothetical protein